MSHFAEFILDMLFSFFEDLFTGKKKKKYNSGIMKYVEWFAHLLRDVLIVAVMAVLVVLAISFASHLLK